MATEQFVEERAMPVVDVDQLISDFEHQDLASYNPDFPAIEEGVYTFKLAGSVRTKSGEGKKGPWFRKAAQLRVVSDGPARGRSVWVDEFSSTFTRFAKAVMEATGISQDADEGISDYLNKVAGMDATFQAKVVKEYNDFRGKDDNKVIIGSISKV